MAARPFGTTGSDAAPAGGLRRTIDPAAVREVKARRSINALLLSLDDSTLATFGFDRRGLEEAGRCPLPF